MGTETPGDGTRPAVSMAEAVRNVTFRSALKGYNIDEVDQYLGELADRLEGGAPVEPAGVRSVAFRQALKGYRLEEVDEFLEAVARQLPGG